MTNNEPPVTTFDQREFVDRIGAAYLAVEDALDLLRHADPSDSQVPATLARLDVVLYVLGRVCRTAVSGR